MWFLSQVCGRAINCNHKILVHIPYCNWSVCDSVEIKELGLNSKCSVNNVFCFLGLCLDQKIGYFVNNAVIDQQLMMWLNFNLFRNGKLLIDPLKLFNGLVPYWIGRFQMFVSGILGWKYCYKEANIEGLNCSFSYSHVHTLVYQKLYIQEY